MGKLVTATGKSFDCDYFNVFDPASQVNIRVLGVSLVDAATVFGNRDETIQLWWGKNYVAQYTRVIAIVPELDAIRIVLGKE